ncbi:MAG: hypothetical protein HY015_09960 [Bacteroidetes bacterium]|nr:hypothetical protein [Bacteroidota bacterium]MBI3483275.1 hypothetical protein [Bacteroidota bacterium]
MKNKLGVLMIVAILTMTFACDSKKTGDEATATDSTTVQKDSTVAKDSTKVDSTKAK